MDDASMNDSNAICSRPQVVQDLLHHQAELPMHDGLSWGLGLPCMDAISTCSPTPIYPIDSPKL